MADNPTTAQVPPTLSPSPRLSHDAAHKKHLLDYVTVIVASVAAVAALVAAGFSWWQASIAQDTAKRQLRAYLAVSVPDNALHNFGEGKKALVQGILDNMGETPAYKAGWMAGVNVQENTEEIRWAYDSCATIMKQPGSSEWFIGKKPSFPDKERKTPFTKKEIDEIMASKAAIYFHGRVCYLDIFEETQALDFCIFWDWDRNNNRLNTVGTFCRHGNGPPESASIIPTGKPNS